LPPIRRQNQPILASIFNNGRLRDQLVKDAYAKLHHSLDNNSKIDATYSGTTACTVIISKRTLICANAGDSRTILISNNAPGEGGGVGHWTARPLSRDHKPDLDEEATRIKKQQGRVEQSRLTIGMCPPSQIGKFYGPLRVWVKGRQVPGLAMSRSIGDYVATEVGVTFDPEIMSVELGKGDKCVVIGSDGLWDRMTNEQVARVVSFYYGKGDAEGAAT